MLDAPRHRGLTLLEVMIALTVTLVVVAGAIVVVNSQQKAYHDGLRLRGAQGSARRALLSFERTLSTAGFGMDAALAFDLQGWVGGPCPDVMGTCPRDSVGDSDELVFFARNPRYWIPATNADDPVGNAWRIAAVSSGAVSVHARAGDVFRNGQIFLAVCSGSSSYAYFTASGTVSVAAAGTVSVPLAASVASNPFRRQDVATALGCFSATPPADPARLFLVDRYRYHVRPVAIAGSGTGTRYDPLLVLDRGVDMDLDGDVDQDDEELVAEGVESLQVGYVFYNGALPLAGATAGTAVATSAGTAADASTAADTITATLFPGATPQPGQTAYVPSSFYPYTFGPPPAAERLTNRQANIQAVRVAVLARSTGSDMQGASRADSYFPLLNQNALPAWITGYATTLGGHDGYQRIVLDATVSLPNMATRAMTYF
jgi:type IV pilus assembly protein PilW